MSNVSSAFHTNNKNNNHNKLFFFEKKFNSFLFLSIFSLLHAVHSYNKATRQHSAKARLSSVSCFHQTYIIWFHRNLWLLGVHWTRISYVIHGLLWYINVKFGNNERRTHEGTNKTWQEHKSWTCLPIKMVKYCPIDSEVIVQNTTHTRTPHQWNEWNHSEINQ